MEQKIGYELKYSNPHRHFLNVEMAVSGVEGEEIELQLPSWRPGRYELGDFAQNIQILDFFDGNGNALKFKKKTKDRWLVNCGGEDTVVLKYNVYAKELGGGGTYLDSDQLYVNPVNCCMYVVGREWEECRLQLDIPTEWRVAIGLPKIGTNTFVAKSFDHLADSPFIASGTLQHNSYEVAGTKFNMWFQGEFKPEWDRIIEAFTAFTEVQLDVMKSFPFDEYHFLFQICTYPIYHGVEHHNSTIIVLGPSYDIMKETKYYDFLGVSSHELFHAWNVKAIRPIEMQPYDFSKENYSNLGYVAEGVTTYYGDLFLYRAKCFSRFEYFKELHQLFQRHFHNYGTLNLSVAESSFDTWLDGYKKGIPHRKGSIYTEGALVALMLDLSLRRDTNNQRSLDDVMRLLYERFGKTSKGYSESDYQQTVEEVAGKSYQSFFDDFYYGTKNIEPYLKETLDFVGLEIKNVRSRLYFENRFGFKVEYIKERSARVIEVTPNSIADKAEIKLGDEILSINGIRILGNLKEWCKYFEEETVTLTINSEDDTHKMQLTPTDERYYRSRWPQPVANLTDEQKNNFESWTGQTLS
jgi:predicted metalloprotease with PDZ domain